MESKKEEEKERVFSLSLFSSLAACNHHTFLYIALNSLSSLFLMF